MIKCIIVDDEKFAQQSLQLILKNSFATTVEIVGVAGSVQEALKLMRAHTIDLVLLDIDMPKEDGFELLKQAPYTNFKIIFTTAYAQYALGAIKQHALDYLLKPIDEDELKLALDKVQLQDKTTSATTIELLLHSINNTVGIANKVPIAITSGFELVRTNEIVCLYAQEHKTDVHLINGTVLCSTKKMGVILTDLPKNEFCRIHKSHAVNLSLIKQYNRSSGNVIMVNGKELAVSVNEKRNFLMLFK